MSSRAACRSRSSEQDSSRPFPIRRCCALEDPHDRNGDGVSGRAGIVVDVETGERRVGRFGWKAQHATLITFGADAYRNEMGITNDLFPQESAFGITPEQMRLCDPSRIPKTFAIRGLAGAESTTSRASCASLPQPRARRRQRPGTDGRAGLRRNRLHRPAMCRRSRPGRTPIRYSIGRQWPCFRTCSSTTSAQATASSRAARKPNEIRTPALWGLRFRRPLLHDGTATLEEAILTHAREAELARRGFERLSDGGSRSATRISRIALS